MASTTPTVSSSLASPGVGSGLDVSSIVSKLMSVERRPLALMDAQITDSQSKISAYGTLKGALSGVQSSLAGLRSAAGFRTLSASVSDAALLTTSVGSNAVAGNYSVEVTKLAQAHKLASSGFATASDAVGTGLLTFDFGTFDGASFTSSGSGAKTVTIAAGQSSLAGIRDAINAASIGVTATIVNDGSASGNRLVLTSNATGAASSLKITVTDADGNATDASGLSQLAYDPAGSAGNGKNLSQSVAAQDAELTIDGITMHKPTNTVSDAIQGVTLNLLKTNSGAPASLAVSSNTGAVTALVVGFVNAYNALQNTLGNLTSYDSAQQKASVLTGDGAVRLIQTQLRSILGASLPVGGYRTLSQAGVAFKTDGTLSLDTAKLDTALRANPTAVTQLFAALGTTNDALAAASDYSIKTQPGDYALAVSQLATQAKLAGNAAAALTITEGVNDQLSITIDGTAATVTLAAGTYASAGALAAEVQAKINGASALAGSKVVVTQSGGTLTITSSRYGSASQVSATGTAAETILGDAPVATAGLDVAGTIGGVAATGSGQTLVGAVGSAAEGLKIAVSGGAVGARGTVSFGKGFAYNLDQLITNVLAKDGTIATRSSGLQQSIDTIRKREDAFNRRMDQVQAGYLRQFNALDTLLASLSTQSSYLAQQLDAIAATTKSSK